MLRDVGDPVELAARYAAVGADELVFLDITATIESRAPLLELVERAADTLDVPFTVGGGVRGADDARALLRAGADKDRGESSRLRRARGLLTELSATGSQAVVCEIDWRGGEVVTHGGRTPRGVDALAWARDAVVRGAGELLLTSIDTDGTRNGHHLVLTAAVAEAVETPVIASGGAGDSSHLADVFAVGAEAALVASIVHERPERVPRAEAGAAGGRMERPLLTPHRPGRGERARAHARLDGRGGAAAHARDWAKPGSGAARGRSCGARVRRPATRWRSRSSATTATATRSSSVCGRQRVPSATPAPSPASRRGSGGGSRSASVSGPTALSVVSLLDDAALAARKVGEEGLEAALAGAGEDDERVVSEIADLWFHALVLLAARGLDPNEVEAELARRASR